MNNSLQSTAEKKFAMLEKQLVPLFDKAPHLPEGFRKFLTTIAPWLALIGGVLGLLAMVTAGSAGVLLSLNYFGGGLFGIVTGVTLISGIIISLLELLAFVPLRKMQKRGWNLLFYVAVISFVVAIFTLVLGFGSGIVTQLVFSIIGFWLLFEVRGMYS